MHSPDVIRPDWFKSSYSASQGDCVEVAHMPLEFRRSSYSNAGGRCVEVAHRLDFRKSSHSGTGNACVEIANMNARALVRDSKHPSLGHLTFADTEWSAFLQAIKTGELDR